MITFISFILVLAGCANWLIIGLMQYDFVAGIFGTQSSLLSRIVYIAIGFAAIWMTLMLFVQKGRVKINDNGFQSLNKAIPAPGKNNKNPQNQREQYDDSHERRNDRQGNMQNHGSDFYERPQQSNSQNYNDNFHEQPHPMNSKNSRVDAGNEFHQTNSQDRRNPFD